MYYKVWQCKSPQEPSSITHVLGTLLISSSFQAFPPLECVGAQILSMGFEGKGSGNVLFQLSKFVLGWFFKGSGIILFRGLVTALGANESESYNPLIVSGQTGSGRSSRTLLSLVENFGGKWTGNTGRLDRYLVQSLLICCLERTS